MGNHDGVIAKYREALAKAESPILLFIGGSKKVLSFLADCHSLESLTTNMRTSLQISLHTHLMLRHGFSCADAHRYAGRFGAHFADAVDQFKLILAYVTQTKVSTKTELFWLMLGVHTNLMGYSWYAEIARKPVLPARKMTPALDAAVKES